MTLQTSTVGSNHDASVLERQLESTRKQLQALKEESGRTEVQLRGEVASARGEHSNEVQMLVTKLEESVATYNSSVAEAERMMGAKEELLRKYKEEARAASSKLQSYQVTVLGSYPSAGTLFDSHASVTYMFGSHSETLLGHTFATPVPTVKPCLSISMHCRAWLRTKRLR